MLKCYKETVSFIKYTNKNELQYLNHFYDIHDKDVFYDKLEQIEQQERLTKDKIKLAKIYFIRCNFIQYFNIRTRLPFNELFSTFTKAERLALNVLKNNYHTKLIKASVKEDKKNNEYYKTFTTGLYANSNLTIEDFINSDFQLLNYDPDYQYIPQDNENNEDKPFRCVCGEKLKNIYHLISKTTLDKFDNKIIILKIGSICRKKFFEVHAVCKYCTNLVKDDYKNININDKVFRCCKPCHSKLCCQKKGCKNLKSNIYSTICVDCGNRQKALYLPNTENNEIIKWTDKDNEEFLKYNDTINEL